MGSLAVSFDGRRFLVAWDTVVNGASAMFEDELWGLFLDPAGQPQGAPSRLVSAATPMAVTPAIAWTGQGYVLLWRNPDVSRGVPGVSGVELRPDGTPFGTGFLVENRIFPPRQVTAASLGGGQAVGAYTVMDPAAPFNARRARSRLITMDGRLGDACSVGTDCLSGFCDTCNGAGTCVAVPASCVDAGVMDASTDRPIDASVDASADTGIDRTVDAPIDTAVVDGLSRDTAVRIDAPPARPADAAITPDAERPSGLIGDSGCGCLVGAGSRGPVSDAFLTAAAALFVAVRVSRRRPRRA